MADTLKPVVAGEPAVGATAFPVPDTTSPRPLVPLSSAVSMPAAEAEGAAVQKEALRPTASKWESAKASASEWLPVNVYDYITTPKFTPEAGFSTAERIKHETIQLSTDEEKFLASGSNAEYDWRRSRIEAHRKNVQAMGDNQVTSFLASAIDPGYLALDAMSAGAGRIARLARGSRMAVGGTLGTAGAYAAGVIEQQVTPIATEEVVLNAFANGIASGVFVGPGGKLVRKTSPETDALKVIADDYADNIRDSYVMPGYVQKVDPDGNPMVSPNGKPVLTPVERAQVKDTPQASVQIPKIIDESAAGTGRVNNSVARPTAPTVDVPTAPPAQRLLDALNDPGVTRQLAGQPKVDLQINTPKIESNAIKGRGTIRDALNEAIEKTPDAEVRAFATNFLERVGRMADEIPVIRRDSIKRSYYHAGEHAIYMRGNAEPWVLAHEVSHALTVHKLRLGRAKPDSVHGQIYKELDAIRKAAAPELSRHGSKYYADSIEEFVAGVYSNRPGFIKVLSEMPDPGTGNRKSILNSLVDAIRRLMGMGADDMNAFLRALNLTQELMDQPVGVRVKSDKASRNIYYAPDASTANIPTTLPSEVISKQLDDLWGKHSGAKGVAHAISWSLAKSLGKHSTKVKRLLVDDPLESGVDSAASYQRSIRADLSAHQKGFENLMLDAMAKAGAGTRQRAQPWTARKAMEVQKQIERQLGHELDKRMNASVDGKFTKPANYIENDITKMADAWQDMMDAGLKEMQQSGVFGADAMATSAGYFSRRWNAAALEDSMQRWANATGRDLDQAKIAMKDLMKQAIRAKNPDWSDELLHDVASAMVDRTIRKGEFSDAEFRGHIGNNNLVELRDDLRTSGVPESRIQAIMDKMAGVTDEANRSSYMKSRVDLDPKASINLPDGTKITIHDLISTDMSNIAERYLDDVAGKSALARVGLDTESAISKLRTEAIQGIKDTADREDFKNLFNNTIDAIMGRPVGADMSRQMRFLQAMNQMMGLAASGLWQVTEYAKIAQHHGFAATLGYAIREFPQLFNVKNLPVGDAGSLENILTRNASQDIRLRPFLNKLEDGYEIPTSAVLEHAMTQAKQWIPYINGMKFVHHHQARVSANLITDTLVRAAKGDAKAMKALEKYGLESQLMDTVRGDIATHGADTTKWKDGTWDAIRNPLNRMMDDDVLRSRTGEIPAFAQFSQIGKFLFTFRSFVLAAHNKILAGTLNRDGLAGLSILLAYQYPASLAAVQANRVASGREPLEGNEWIMAAVSQSGGIGLFSEFAGLLSGQKKEWGTPGLIAVDRGYRVLGAVGSAAFGEGSAGGAAAAAINAMPIISILPGVRGATEALKGD